MFNANEQVASAACTLVLKAISSTENNYAHDGYTECHWGDLANGKYGLYGDPVCNAGTVFFIIVCRFIKGWATVSPQPFISLYSEFFIVWKL